MWDVIVVGARCAGSPIGMLLARRGYRVLMLDRDPLPSDMVASTHLIHQRGVACLARWGLRDDVAAMQRHPIEGCRFDFGAITLSGNPPAVGGEASAFAPRRRLLDAALIRAAKSSGAEIRDRHRVDDLVVEDDRVTGVSGVSAGGTGFREQARLVIGADGPSSRVAKAAGAEEYDVVPALQTTGWIYWDVPLDHFELHQRDYEAVYAFPSSNGTLIGANWAMERFKSVRGNVEAAYFDLLRGAAPELVEMVGGAKRADDRLYLGSTRSFFRKAHGPGWVLLGDARCKKDPCTAQGITDAFCDAEALAEAVEQSFGGTKPLDAALAEYERERVAWDRPFYAFTCELAKFEPLPPAMVALFSALQGNQEATDRFIGVLTEATSPAAFFAPENMQQIMGRHAGDPSAGDA